MVSHLLILVWFIGASWFLRFGIHYSPDEFIICFSRIISVPTIISDPIFLAFFTDKIWVINLWFFIHFNYFNIILCIFTWAVLAFVESCSCCSTKSISISRWSDLSECIFVRNNIYLFIFLFFHLIMVHLIRVLSFNSSRFSLLIFIIHWI